MKYHPKSAALTRIRGYAHQATVGRMKRKAASMKPLSPQIPTEAEGDEDEELLRRLVHSNEG